LPFYTPPSEADITYISCTGLADNYRDELAAQLDKKPEEITPKIVKACIKVSLDSNVFTKTFYDSLGYPRAVFGLSHSGAVSYIETKNLQPMTRARWAREAKGLPEMLRRATGLTPWCYSDARNSKASRLLEWFHFKHVPQKDILINGYTFKYYELSVAE